jgi:hypothetical protein
MDVFVFIAAFNQVEVSASGWSLVQRSSTEFGVFNESDREYPLEVRGYDPEWGQRATEKNTVSAIKQ